MGDLHKILPVALFELAEARHSRVIVTMAVWCGGAMALATAAFLLAFKSTADAARQMLADEMGVPLSSLPDDLVNERVRPWLLGLVDDEATRELLARLEPLSLFFTAAVSGGVIVAVLLSGNGIRRALAHGAARYELFRVSRLSWSVGMLAAHALLVLAGLLLAVLVALGVGLWLQGAAGKLQPGYLLRASCFSWAYAIAYIGIFNGVLLATGGRARSLGNPVVLLLLLWLAHAVVTSDTAAAYLPGLNLLSWLFPVRYAGAVWSASLVEYTGSVLALLAIGSSASAAGYWAFMRRDV